MADVLFVCTGNLCRSPMAACLFAARLGDVDGIRVGSAGTWGRDGAPMEPEAARVVAELGGDPRRFPGARRLTAELVEAADLVLTAAREHRAAVVTLVPRAARKTFTIREFGRLTAAVDALPGADPAARAAALAPAAAGRRGFIPPVDPADDDIPDPYQGPAYLFDQAGTLIDESLRHAVALVSGRAGAGPAP